MAQEVQILADRSFRFETEPAVVASVFLPVVNRLFVVKSALLLLLFNPRRLFRFFRVQRAVGQDYVVDREVLI